MRLQAPRLLIWLLLQLLLVVVFAADSDNCSLADEAINSSLVLQWTQLAEGDAYTRVSHTTQALAASASTSGKDRLLVLGGIEYESAQPVVTNMVLVYDLVARTFQSATDSIQSTLQVVTKNDVFVSPASRSEHASFVTLNNVVYLFGGQTTEFLNDTWRLCIDSSGSTATWDQLVAPSSDIVSVRAIPAPRIGHSFTLVFENSTTLGAIVFGGLSSDYVDLSTVHLALITKGSSGCNTRSPKLIWRALNTTGAATSPLARSYHSAMTSSRVFSATLMNCLVVYGGKNTVQSIIFNEVWRLCANTSTSTTPIENQIYAWEQLTPIGTTPGPRYGASMTFVDEGRLVLAGGSYTFPNDFLTDTWEFSVNSTQWIRLAFDADFTPPRRGHALAYFASNSQLVLFGGKDRYAVVSNSMARTTYAAPYCALGLKITLCTATGRYVCIACSAGSYLQSGTRNCLLCVAGTYSDLGAAQCTQCPAGTYSTVAGKKASELPCTSCPVGTASNIPGSSSLAACGACAAGSFASATGMTSCTACPAGTFSSSQASSCTLCAAGQWSTSGASSCSICAAGTYSPIAGATACLPCPKGFYSDANSTTCVACPINTFSNTVQASRSGCQSCSTLAFTTKVGQTECQVCPVGSTYSNSSCQPCSAGYYSSDATNGACLHCALGFYASINGSTQCSQCPSGSFTTATASTTLGNCSVCDVGYSYDFGSASCQPCAAGYHASTKGYCTTCAPGSYTASSAAAVVTGTDSCPSCASMTYASNAGATSCVGCVSNSFAMAGWGSCIPCDQSVVAVTCATGRNGLLCAGNGDCAYGACACFDGWNGGDCSVPTFSGSTSSAASVLYFPTTQSPIVINSVRASTSSNVTIQIARSGSVLGIVQAIVAWKQTNLTLSSTPSVLPWAVTFNALDQNQTISIPIATILSASQSSGCRYFTLELQNASGASTNAVSSESDRQLTLYVDDMNGIAGGQTGRSVVAYYAVQTNGTISDSTVVVDRSVSTSVVLTPTSLTSSLLLLTKQPLNILVAIDPNASISSLAVSLFPSIVASLQTVYDTQSIRMGLLGTNQSSLPLTFPSTLNDFFTAAQPAIQALSWKWMTDCLLSTTNNSDSDSQWPSKHRRFLLVIANESLVNTSSSSAALVFQSALRNQSIFALFLLPSTSQVVMNTTDVMASVVFDRWGSIPAQVRTAFQAKDSSLPSQVNVLQDSTTFVTTAAVTAFSVSGQASFPKFSLLLHRSSTASLSNALIVLGIPGITKLTIRLQVPGAACSPSSPTLSSASTVLNGWIDTWSLSSVDTITRNWPSIRPTSTTLQRKLIYDTTLLRSVNSTVLSLSDANTTGIIVERRFNGTLFASGLPLVLRGFLRLPSNLNASVNCSMGMRMIPANSTSTSNSIANISVVAVNSSVAFKGAVPGAWEFQWLRNIIPFEVDYINVSLSCLRENSGPLSVHWSLLGFFPDPAFACECGGGFYVNTDSISSDSSSDTECLRCPAGSYCVAGIKRSCPDGSFSFGKAASCETCRDGWICVDGLARLCTAGTYATAQSCAICPAGYGCRNGKASICPAGTFSLPQASDCASCPPGTISTQQG